jgi:hypothetical protein
VGQDTSSRCQEPRYFFFFAALAGLPLAALLAPFEGAFAGALDALPAFFFGADFFEAAFAGAALLAVALPALALPALAAPFFFAGAFEALDALAAFAGALDALPFAAFFPADFAAGLAFAGLRPDLDLCASSSSAS